MIIVCTKQNIWTSQPCLHTLKETSLSANQRVHTSYFINNYSSTAILFVHYNLLLMLCLFLKKNKQSIRRQSISNTASLSIVHNNCQIKNISTTILFV